MTIIDFARFVGFRELDSTLHSHLIPLIIFDVFTTWPSILCARIHSESFSKSCAGYPRFRRSMIDLCPSSDEYELYCSLLGFSSDFSLLLLWDGFIMRFHDVYLLSWVIEIDRLGALVAAVAGLLVFKWFLRHMLFRVFLKNFSLFRRFPVAIQHACLFHTNQ